MHLRINSIELRHKKPRPKYAYAAKSFDKFRKAPYNVCLCSLIAQLVERRTVNPQVPGSSPGRGAKLKSLVEIQGFFHFSAIIV